jgi:hypothetical protein
MDQRECEALGGRWDATTQSCSFIRKLPVIRLHQGPCGGKLEVRIRFRRNTLSLREPAPAPNVLQRDVTILEALTTNAQQGARRLALAKRGARMGTAGSRTKKAAKARSRATSKKP